MEDINIALLIDADNISARYIPGILSELSKYGKITIRRMYGDWSQERLRSWLAASSGYSLTPMMQQNNTPGKNASDICLIIDAMDILYTGQVQGFCIASSDGDFNKLATRLREAGKVVIGMGEKKTPESFRVSCERFIFLDVIDGAGDDEVVVKPTAKPSAKTKAAAKKKAAPKKKKAVAADSVPAESAAASFPLPAALPDAVSSLLADAADESSSDPALLTEPAAAYAPSLLPEESEIETGSDGEPLFTDKATIENAIVKMITDNTAEGKETGLGEIGSRLVKIFPDFDIRNYHYTKLSEYLKDFSSLSVTNHDNAVWVSLKGSPDSEIEKQIRRIFDRHKTKEMDIAALRRELEDLNPNLTASIRKSGVTRFPVYLNRMIHSVEVNGSRVTLLS
ncbi:MAG: NYN domain-containing protein [Eubacteriales bacterium]|nr:NYN domain-containing protein [Eubacteriales bacterium]